MNLSTTIHWLVGREMQETEEEVHIVQSHKLVLYGGSQSDSDDMTQKINSGVLLSPFTAPLLYLTPALYYACPVYVGCSFMQHSS